VTAEKLNRWLTLGANLGVVVGLGLLIVEIRQNTGMMEAQMHQSRTEAAMLEQQSVYNSAYLPAMQAKIGSGEPLSEEEAVRYEAWFRGFNRNMDNQLWQHRRGFLNDNIPRSVRHAVRAVIGASEIGRKAWERNRTQYTDEYIAFVEEVLTDPESSRP
jgi:hypothetical protein